MPLQSKYLFVASMNVDADKERLFNEVYDTEHVSLLLKGNCSPPLPEASKPCLSKG